jgi:hypothetical protein
MPFAASRVTVAVALAIATLSSGASAATIYSSPTAFYAAVGPHLTDDYQDPAYQQPDNPNETFSDARMSEIFGQATYRTTGLTQRNFVEHQSGDGFYCAGCNGSFELDFTETSVGNQNGVYGVGLHVIANQWSYPYVAFVTYGDDTTESFPLPARNFQTPPPPATFWGITSIKRIRSIHFGGQGGAAVTSGGFAIDNLAIGSTLTTDADADGIRDLDDNCIEAPNGPLIPDAGGASQRDADNDGYGNRCDGDLNNSGLVTSADYFLLRNALNTANPVADLNGSGLVTSADYFILRAMLNQPPGPSGLHP